jgi:hypothetical protein
MALLMAALSERVTSAGTGPHRAREFGAHGLQAMRRDAFDAQLHVGTGSELVGVDVGAEAPDLVHGAHAITSRGSVMRPRSAEAATV